MVLHYYTQLYLLGLAVQTFEAVVVDTDSLVASVRSVRDFFQDLQYGPDAADGVEGKIPVISTPRVPAPSSDKVVTALTGRQEGDVGDHPVRAFFNNETLTQTVNQGLFARPALSSVMSHHVFADSALTPVRDSTLVFVGSVIGGTSGGLLAPMVDAVRSRQIEHNIGNLKMRAVLYGRYFTPNNKIIPDAVRRFNSNEVLVLKSIKEALQQLHSYYIVGGTGLINRTRDPNVEKNGSQLPWPDEQDPFWLGTQAAEYLLKEATIPASSDFSDREVAEFTQPISMGEAGKLRRQRLSFADYFVAKKVVTRLAADPWAALIWGSKLTELLASFWNIAIDAEGGKRVSNFPEKVHKALEALWNGSDGRLGLRNLFPPTPIEAISPGDVARVEWPTVDQSKGHKSLFSSADVVAKRAAAAILFTSLRKGK